MKKAIVFIKKIKKIEFFYKKLLTFKNNNDNIITVKKIELERSKNGRQRNNIWF